MYARASGSRRDRGHPASWSLRKSDWLKARQWERYDEGSSYSKLNIALVYQSRLDLCSPTTITLGTVNLRGLEDDASILCDSRRSL